VQLDSRRQGSAKDYVVQELIHDIVNIKLKPGEKLCEPALCERFGVSRTPFREAELELAQRKLIVVRPKIGTFVSFIDKELVEEVRHLRSVLEAELAVMACSMLTKKDIDRLWENVAVWEMYMQRGDYEKILQLDKSFHAMVYEMCGRTYWHELVESISPHFDRTTVLSFQCRPTDSILSDHKNLVEAMEKKDTALAGQVARQHMERYSENIDEQFSEYFAK
jgi:DNA-binding GntR family transcriptional regulator